MGVRSDLIPACGFSCWLGNWSEIFHWQWAKLTQLRPKAGWRQSFLELLLLNNNFMQNLITMERIILLLGMLGGSDRLSSQAGSGMQAVDCEHLVYRQLHAQHVGFGKSPF